MRAHLVSLSLPLLLVGCGLFSAKPTFRCRAGTHPCGDGCIPTMAVCCDDGSGTTSSYCTNGATGCHVNDDSRGCQAVFPSGQRAKFCCGEQGSFGSNDCPEGQRHCGTLCQPVATPCCPAGSSEKECPEKSWDSLDCRAEPGRVGCGVCLAKDVCVSCLPGYCCQGGLVCGGAGARCVAGPTCTGESGGAGSSSGTGSAAFCSKWKNRCGPASGGIQLVNFNVPRQCGCPEGTTYYADQSPGGYRNESCGLPGTGFDCIVCECPH
ncbi:MAG: hypothetical protein IAE78_31545 [Myxococcus sp.]|nr:hypothetical protein [Myxococcus sp.]